MTENLELKLQKSYPKLFKDLYGDPMSTCMAWGVAVGDGWYDIIDEMCKKMNRIKDANGERIVFAQIKEKFGTLRVYINWPEGFTEDQMKKIYDIEREAENNALITCEVCGKSGSMNGKYWLKVVCDEHKEKTN